MKLFIAHRTQNTICSYIHSKFNLINSGLCRPPTGFCVPRTRSRLDDQFLWCFDKASFLISMLLYHFWHNFVCVMCFTNTLGYLYPKMISFDVGDLNGKFPQATMEIRWVESNFRHPTVTFWANLDIPFKRIIMNAKFCMSPSLDGTLPESVMRQ